MRTHILLLVVMITVATGCLPKKTTTSTKQTGSTDQTTTPSTTGGTTTGGTTTGGTTGTGGTVVNDPFPPYQVNDIIVHGGPGGIVKWTSTTDNNQGAYFSDTRFQVKLKANTGPGKYALDHNGVQCSYFPLPYTKLQAKIKVRTTTNTTGLTQVMEASIGSSSAAVAFNTAQLVTSDPFIVEVSDVKWDYSCIDYAKRGYPNYPAACPWDYVWANDCVSFSLEIATDGTSAL